MSSIMVQDLATYNASMDYEWLAQESQKHSIICIVDYTMEIKGKMYVYRDIGKTIYSKRESDQRQIWQISGRGTGYLTAFSQDEFIKMCKLLNVQIIKP